MMTSEPEHPGTIVFIDGNTQEVTREVEAAEVPTNIRFVKLDEGVVPVVKIITFTSDEQRTIRQYGADGRLLRSTVQVRRN